MNVLARVAAFTVTLAALGGTAAAVGASVGPLDAAVPAEHAEHSAGGRTHGTGHTAGHTAGDPDEATSAAQPAGLPGGLQVSEQGYTLRFLRDRHQPSAERELRFQVLDEQGRAHTRFETLHGKPLHLVVVRRDLGSFEHVHPQMSPDGTWSVEVDLAAAGTYRAFADVQPVGAKGAVTLGQDLFVPGRFVPRPLPAADTSADVDGYDVELAGALVPGETSRLTLTVARDGVPVSDLQPYLEAYGHLVALRVGDLAYLHVHPEGTPGDGTTLPGPEVTFYVEVPSAGTYRLHLDFRHGDEVRTAAFTVVAGPTTGSTPPPTHDLTHPH